MKRRLFLSLVLCSSFLGACGSSSTVRQPLAAPSDKASPHQYKIADISASAAEVPVEFQKNLRKYLEKDLSKRGMLGNGDSARKVSVKITEFSMSSGGSRFILGAFAGKDFVKADVNVVDSTSGKIIGSSTIESKDRLSSGSPELFTSMHAKAISKFLQGKS